MRRPAVQISARFAVGLAGALIAPAVLAAALAILPHVARRIEAREALNIVALGSSSTEGIGATAKDKTYPARLQTILDDRLPDPEPVSVVNRGIGGEDVDDMMRRLPGVIAEHPDLVIWQTGSNDALRGVPVDHFIAATRTGIEQLRAAGIDVMLMEPQLSERLARTPDSLAYRDAVRALGRETGAPVIRRYDLMREWLASGELTATQMMAGDGLHMTDGGYEKLAEAVADTILADGRSSAPNVAAK